MLEQVGKKIRIAREASGISQKKLGMILGLSDKAISAYESGRTLPPIETLYRISQELGRNLSYFLSDKGEESSIFDKIDKMDRVLTDISVELQEIRRKLIATSQKPEAPPNEPQINYLPESPTSAPIIT